MRDFFSFFKPTEEDPGVDLGRRLVLTGGLSFVVATMAGCDGEFEKIIDPDAEFKRRFDGRSPKEIIQSSGQFISLLKTTLKNAGSCTGQSDLLSILIDVEQHPKFQMPVEVLLALIQIESLQGQCGSMAKTSSAAGLTQIVSGTQKDLAKKEFTKFWNESRGGGDRLFARLFADLFAAASSKDKDPRVAWKNVEAAADIVQRERSQGIIVGTLEEHRKKVLSDIDRESLDPSNPENLKGSAAMAVVFSAWYLNRAREALPDVHPSWWILYYYAGPGVAAQWYSVALKEGIARPLELLSNRTLRYSLAVPPGGLGIAERHLQNFEIYHPVVAALKTEGYARLRNDTPTQSAVVERKRQVGKSTESNDGSGSTTQIQQYPARAVRVQSRPQSPSQAVQDAPIYNGSSTGRCWSVAEQKYVPASTCPPGGIK